MQNTLLFHLIHDVVHLSLTARGCDTSQSSCGGTHNFVEAARMWLVYNLAVGLTSGRPIIIGRYLACPQALNPSRRGRACVDAWDNEINLPIHHIWSGGLVSLDRGR